MSNKLSATLVAIAMLFVLGACSLGGRDYGPVVANPAANPTDRFVKLHLRNDFASDVVVTEVWLEREAGGGWQRVRLNQNADPNFVISNVELGTDEGTRRFSTILRFDNYLDLDQSQIGRFRVAVEFAGHGALVSEPFELW